MGDDDFDKRVNLKSIRRLDSDVKSILSQANHVTLYRFKGVPPKGEWVGVPMAQFGLIETQAWNGD